MRRKYRPVVLLSDLRAVFNGYIAELRKESPTSLEEKFRYQIPD